MERLSEEVAERHRRVTLLINNAGVALLGTFEEISIEEFDWLLRINFWGVIHGAKYFLPLLRREPRAHIVNVSSMFGLMATPGNSAYCASKFAVRGFTEALRHELEGSTIIVSCVHPGRVRTPISRRARISEGIFNRSEFDENREGTDLGPTSPQEAANRIVEGIKRGEPRILIGPDAIWLDRLQRMFPVRAGRILSSLRKIRRKLWNRSGS
jgi:short-subunit dehydrogenase